MFVRLPVIALVALLCMPAGMAHAAPPRPNILFILADDLGWGDVGCFNPQSKIPTPSMDRLASEGLRFTDAHSSAGVCVPSRFSIITGMHAFRMKGKGHPEPQYKHYGGNQSTVPLVPADRATLPGVLLHAGYSTAMVGKWHLGFDDVLRKPTEPLRGGPIDRGFQRFFGIPSSLDYGPYVLIDGDRIVAQATEKMPAHSSPGWARDFQGEFWREDIAAPGFHHVDILPAMTRRAEQYLREMAGGAKEHPFFLYYAMPAPHSPLVPSQAFRGKTNLGPFGAYGDYVAQTDADIGHLLHVLDDTGLADNTIVIVSSDNGPLWYPKNVEVSGHSASGPWLGMKGDAWEGGHRMPFIVRWPGHVPKNAVSSALISQTDLLATFAGLLELPAVPTDGADFSAALSGKEWTRPDDKPLIARSSMGVESLRDGKWKFIAALGSGGFSTPATQKPGADGVATQLYDLSADPGETRNLAGEQKEKVIGFQQMLQKLTSRDLPLEAAKPK